MMMVKSLKLVVGVDGFDMSTEMIEEQERSEWSQDKSRRLES